MTTVIGGTSQTVEVRHQPIKIVPRFVMAAFLIALGGIGIGSALQSPILHGGRNGDAFGYIVVLLGGVAFIAASLHFVALYLYNLVTIQGPVLLFDVAGFRDMRGVHSCLPWTAMNYLRFYERSRAIEIVLRPGAGRSLGLRRDVVRVETVGLSMGPAAIKEELVARIANAKAASVIERDA